METSILKKAGELLLERSRYRQWYRCVAGMAAVVVIRVLAAHYHWNLPKARQ